MIVLFILISIAIIILLVLFLFQKYISLKCNLLDYHKSQWNDIKNKVWKETSNGVNFGKYCHDRYIKVAGTIYRNNKIDAVDMAYKNYIDSLINIKFLGIIDIGKSIPPKGRYPYD